MSGEDEREQEAAAETVVVPDGADAGRDEGRADESARAAHDAATVVVSEDSDEGTGPGSAAAAETVLADDDDRTQLVTGPAAGPAAEAPASSGAGPRPTRVLGETGGGGSDADGDGDLDAATRVVGEEPDKTAPPSVSVQPTRDSSTRVRPPAPIDPERGLEPGTILFGEYEIVNVLGIGGMGEVYRARHRRLDEHRAIKVMHAELSKKKGASEFFYREAKALLAVRHPAVAHCHDLLSDDAGRVYLIMEMIEGIPLSKRMNDGPLSPDEVAILGARISHGLAAAHRKGVIHRDVSPDNIVLPNGRVQEAKLIDFGIAKILQEGEGTIVDGFKGKLSYASPEQLGFFGGKLDGRSDFYSLGLVLAAAALGRPMAMGTTVMEAVDARRGFQALPDEIPVGLRSAILPLLALDPEDRPRYVDRLFVVPHETDVLSDGGGFAGTAGTPTDRRPTRSGSGRTPLYAGLAAALALTIGGGAWWAVGVGGARPDPEAAAEGPRQPTGRAGEAGPPAVTTAERETAAEAPAEESADPGEATVQARAEKTPAEPQPRALSAAERIQIIGLLSNARLALEENRLMSPPGDNAYDRYQRILSLDPDNAKALDGLRQVAARYISLADRLVAQGDVDQARTYLDRARRADADHPGLERLQARLDRAGGG